MDKELQDGGEQEDTWSGEGAEALARDLLVDGETGESFPAQVLCSQRPPAPQTYHAAALPENLLWVRVVSLQST